MQEPQNDSDASGVEAQDDALVAQLQAEIAAAASSPQTSAEAVEMLKRRPEGEARSAFEFIGKREKETSNHSGSEHMIIVVPIENNRWRCFPASFTWCDPTTKVITPFKDVDDASTETLLSILPS